MSFKDFYDREKHVALNAQSRRFRIIKWVIIFVIAGALYKWKGIAIVALLFLALGIAGIALHFFLRYNTISN